MNRSHRQSRGGNIKDASAPFQTAEGDIMIFQGDRGLDIQFKLRLLADLLQCPLCKGYFREAYTIRECLHTYCKACIYTYIASGNTQCPKCNGDLPSNIEEGIGFDRIIQNLVDKVLPHFVNIETIEKEKLYKFCGFLDSEIPSSSLINPLSLQSQSLTVSNLPSSSTTDSCDNKNIKYSPYISTSQFVKIKSSSNYTNSNYDIQNSSNNTVSHLISTSTNTTLSSMMNTVENYEFDCLKNKLSFPNLNIKNKNTGDTFMCPFFASSSSITWHSTQEYFTNLLNSLYKISVHQNLSIALFTDDRKLNSLALPYIRTSSSMLVAHLSLYVVQKLEIIEPPKLEMTIDGQLIHKSHTLQFVCKSKRLDPSRCIVIKYRLERPSISSFFF